MNRTSRTPVPKFISKITDDLIGRRVWYVDPTSGVSSIVVVDIYSAMGGNRQMRYGLLYEYQKKKGSIGRKTLWVKDYTLFDSRGKCNQWLKAMIEKSEAERVMNKALGLE